jgi:sugar phosphate isomerase/epimerase
MRHEIDRRRFLQATGLGLGALLAGCARCSASSEAGAQMSDTMSGAGAGTSGATATANTAGAAATGARTEHIGVQLYSVRESMQKDMAGTLKNVADIGYREVEFAGYYKHDPKDVRAMLDRVGLKAPSAHVPLEAMRKDIAGVLAGAEVVGHRYVICPYAEGKTLADWQRLAADLNKFGKAAQERGIQMAYHNHDFEFRPIAGGTRTPYDVLLAETDAALVKMQLDLFWAVKAAQEPVALFGKHPGRFPLVHVKDMRDIKGTQALAADNSEGVGPHMVDVGAGDIDFKSIFAASQQAGLQYYVVEHDAPKDPIASVRTSFGNLKGMLG